MFIETGALPSNGRISPFSSLNTMLPLIRSMEVRSTIKVSCCWHPRRILRATRLEIRQRVLHLVADHAVVILLSGHRTQVASDRLVSLLTVKIVGIDYGKEALRWITPAAIITAWFVPQGLTRSASTVNPAGSLSSTLKYRHLRSARRNARGEYFTEFLFEKMTNHEDDLTETGGSHRKSSSR